MKHLVYALLAAISIASSCSSPKKQEVQVLGESKTIDKQAISRIDSTLKSMVESGQVAGVSSLIFEDNKEVYFNAFGFADKEAGIPMQRNTIVQLYSMTKPITGTALMTLHEKGVFQLDDPISKYAPEFTDMEVYTGVDDSGNMLLEPANRPITIRDVTRHTGGFTYGTNLPVLGKLMSEVGPLAKENTLKQMGNKLATLPLLFQPGAQWNYGISVDVQAYLVEQISGQPFDRYVRENVLDPLGMKETRYVVPEEDRNRFSAMYNRTENGGISRAPDSIAHQFNTNDWPLKPGGHGLTSTIDDYMTFARMLVNEGTLNNATILKPETVKLMSTNALADSVTERSWLPFKGQVGFGIDFAVRVNQPASAEEMNGVVGEFFWDGRASTLFWVDPVNELTAVYFVQIIPTQGILHKQFRDAVYGLFSPGTK